PNPAILRFESCDLRETRLRVGEFRGQTGPSSASCEGRTLKTARGEIQDLPDLLRWDLKPLRNFLNSGTSFEVLEDDRNRHASILKHPCPAHPSGYTLHYRTL